MLRLRTSFFKYKSCTLLLSQSYNQENLKQNKLFCSHISKILCNCFTCSTGMLHESLPNHPQNLFLIISFKVTLTHANIEGMCTKLGVVSNEELKISNDL